MLVSFVIYSIETIITDCHMSACNAKYPDVDQHQEKILLSDENVGILRALYALISAYNHLSELQNEVTATSKSDNHISANITFSFPEALAIWKFV